MIVSNEHTYVKLIEKTRKTNCYYASFFVG